MARAPRTKFKLQPADPFDLIRWLARTQNDPRKAIAELVQNSIDARARTITIERKRLKGAPALIIRDDGEGVLPTLGREEALRHLGTNIGHSHKLGLSPTERHARVIAGQYGVGLLGFWSIGRRMEIRSRVAGSDLHTLALEEDRPTAQLGRMPVALDAPPTFTELVIYEVHEAAQRPLSGRRLVDYLAAELRGPLLQSNVSVEVHDHLARGLAQKRFPVTPRRYDGVKLDVPGEIAVEGFSPIRVELYLSPGAERPAIHLACAGTLVADDIAEIDMLDVARAPWRGREVTGIIDFPSFQVPPGTRRGIVPNAAATAFARALLTLEPLIEREVAAFAKKRRAEADRHVVDDLRKALRGLREKMPHYDLPSVTGGSEPDERAAPGARLGRKPPLTDEGAEPPKGDEGEPQVALFPPGPLAAVTISPEVVRIVPGAERRVHARPTDADGRRLDGIELTWSLADPANTGGADPSSVRGFDGSGGADLSGVRGFEVDGSGGADLSAVRGFEVDGSGPRPAVRAAGDVLPGSSVVLVVRARQGDHIATASATVVAIESPEDRSSAGIPKPELVDDAGAPWRSRMEGSQWQVNSGHEDYLGLDDGRARVRYLVSLLAKEIVQRTYSLPGNGEVLEHLVAVIAHAERNLRGERGRLAPDES